MFKFLYSSRYLALVAVICSFAAAILMFIMGAVKTFKAASHYFTGLPAPAPALEGIGKADMTTKFLVQSVDAFLFALVLLIFALGTYNLFVKPLPRAERRGSFWLSIRSIGHLKSSLAELIIIILFVKFLELVLIDVQALSWEALILPVSIGLLAGAMKLLDLRHDVDVLGGEPSESD